MKSQTLLADIGWTRYLNDRNNPKPLIKIPILTKRQEKGQEKIQEELNVTCNHYKDWKLQIHW